MLNGAIGDPQDLEASVESSPGPLEPASTESSMFVFHSLRTIAVLSVLCCSPFPVP